MEMREASAWSMPGGAGVWAPATLVGMRGGREWGRPERKSKPVVRRPLFAPLRVLRGRDSSDRRPRGGVFFASTTFCRGALLGGTPILLCLSGSASPHRRPVSSAVFRMNMCSRMVWRRKWRRMSPRRFVRQRRGRVAFLWNRRTCAPGRRRSWRVLQPLRRPW